MTGVPLAEIVVALLLLASGGVVLLAALGLLRLPDFFLRMHAPALASTLAAWIVTLASIVHFSSRGGRCWLIIIGCRSPHRRRWCWRAAAVPAATGGRDLPPPLSGAPPRA
jgi:multicomponent K+:H+ antiporter subunit G